MAERVNFLFKMKPSLDSERRTCKECLEINRVLAEMLFSPHPHPPTRHTHTHTRARISPAPQLPGVLRRLAAEGWTTPPTPKHASEQRAHKWTPTSAEGSHERFLSAIIFYCVCPLTFYRFLCLTEEFSQTEACTTAKLCSLNNVRELKLRDGCGKYR